MAMSHLSVKILFLSTLLAASFATSEKCRGLALEGGGDIGSYQAGALKGLLEAAEAEELEYDVVTGISAGSLNALGFALYPKGQEQNASDFLYDVWSTLDQTAVYKNWPKGPLEGIFSERGLFDTSPLRSLVEARLTDTYQERSVFFGTTNQDNGTLAVYNNLTISREDTVNAVMSSSSVPFIFPFQVWNNQADMDGMCKMNLNISPAINYCREKGFQDEDIIIDAILCDGEAHISTVDASKYTTLDILGRLRSIISYDNTNKYMIQIKESYPKIDYRYIVAPTQALPDGAIPLGFKHTEMMEMYNIGVEDGKTVVEKQKTSSSLDRLIENYQKKQADNFVSPFNNFIF